MKIKNIKINQYGVLANKDITLEDGINLICGKNESGKSTLLNYIKSIFYGISKKKNGKEISDYEKYTPWMKEEFSGKLQYELDNGEVFEIFRDFHHKNPKIFNEHLEEISKEFIIDKKDGIQFFDEQTHVDEMTFLSTIVSMQQEVRLEKENQSILLQKLANLAGTGDDNVYFQKTLDRLNKKQLEIGTDRTQGKPLNKVQNKMKELSREMKEQKTIQEEKASMQGRKKEIIDHIQELTVEHQIFTKLHELSIEKSIEEEKINLKHKIKEETQEKIKNLQEQKGHLTESHQQQRKTQTHRKHHSSKKYLLSFLGMVLLSVALKILNDYVIKNAFLNAGIYVLARC